MRDSEFVEMSFERAEKYLTKMFGQLMQEEGASIFGCPEEAMPYFTACVRYWRETKEDTLKYLSDREIAAKEKEIERKEEIRELKDELREQRRLLNDILLRVSMPE